MATEGPPAALILVVDDEPDLLDNMQEWLTLSGYHTLAAANGAEAEAIAREHPVEVAITDLKMPDISGLDLLDRLKAHDPTIEVIVLTGYGTSDDAAQALSAGGAFDFIKKPLRDLNQLNDVVDRALAHRRAKQAGQAPG